MPARNTEKALNKSGVEISRSIAIGKERLKLVRRLVSEDELTAALKSYYSKNALATHFDLTIHDIDGLLAYYELELQSKPAHRGTTVRVDLVAERVWELIEPRVEQKLEAETDLRANRLWLKYQPLVEALIDARVQQLLG